jgi:hypothetical protein
MAPSLPDSEVIFARSQKNCTIRFSFIAGVISLLLKFSRALTMPTYARNKNILRTVHIYMRKPSAFDNDMGRPLKAVFAASLLAAALCAAPPCRAIWWGATAASVWVSTPMALDGNDKKWRPADGDEDSGIAYAFANDGRDLYLMLSPHTRSARDQLAGTYVQDFTVWVDTAGGKAKRTGVRLSAPAGRYDRGPREVLPVGVDTASVCAADKDDLPDVRFTAVTEERYMLEARIPLRLFGAQVPESMNIGLETSEAKAEAPRQARPSGGWSGGNPRGGPGEDGGAGAFGGGRRGGRRGGGVRQKTAGQDAEDLTPLKVWIKVKIAGPAKAGAR